MTALYVVAGIVAMIALAFILMRAIRRSEARDRRLATAETILLMERQGMDMTDIRAREGLPPHPRTARRNED